MENVVVQRNAFVFCRYGVAVLVWAALLLRNVPLLVAVFAILALSAALKVQRAPMVWLYSETLGRALPSEEVVLDARAMRAAHTAGALMALLCLAALGVNATAGWLFVAVFAVLKTTSALGFCPAYKLYGCMAAGGCCTLTGKR